MSVQTELIARMADAKRRLERLEAREQRRLITDYDWLRGWKDDFLGRVEADQYDTTDFAGAGSTFGLRDAAHGGVLRLTSGPAAGRYYALWLGDFALGGITDSLSADPGFVMIGRLRISDTTNIITSFGIQNAAANRRILVRANTAVGGNWYLVTQDGFGTTTGDSGIAIDGDWHVHAIKAQAAEVEYYLDGTWILTSTTNIPADVLTPYAMCQSNGAAARWMNMDWWDVIPRM